MRHGFSCYKNHPWPKQKPSSPARAAATSRPSGSASVPDCNQWNTFAEERFEKASTPRGELSLGTKEDPAPIHDIDTAEEGRVLSGIGEFDRVLGGGLVPGSVILIGGDPGIGKSTLLLQAFAAVSQKGLTCLYVSGEESPRQIKMRAERLGIARAQSARPQRNLAGANSRSRQENQARPAR